MWKKTKVSDVSSNQLWQFTPTIIYWIIRAIHYTDYAVIVADDDSGQYKEIQLDFDDEIMLFDMIGECIYTRIIGSKQIKWAIAATTARGRTKFHQFLLSTHKRVGADTVVYKAGVCYDVLEHIYMLYMANLTVAPIGAYTYRKNMKLPALSLSVCIKIVDLIEQYIDVVLRHIDAPGAKRPIVEIYYFDPDEQKKVTLWHV